MAIPESQLETWSHQGSIKQSSDTYATIRKAVMASDTKYADRNFEVFLQGSYGNDTNIYAESDVDVVIRLDSVYHYNIEALTPEEKERFHAGSTPGTYAYSQYKAEVVAALEDSFGDDVEVGTRAVKIKANGGRRSADVVVATEYRKYYSNNSNLYYLPDGICFCDSSGKRIENYPKTHSANCTTKHQATDSSFKPMVRILKNMRSKMVEDGAIDNGCAPSYFIEGLLHNVPKDKFSKNRGDTFAAAVNWILDCKRDDLETASGRHYLVRDGASICWPSKSYELFMKELVALWNNW
jgi:hypothetical protein